MTWLDALPAFKQLLVFLSGAYVWEKAKASTLSPRFVAMMAVNAAIVAYVLLLVVEEVFTKWIA